MRVATQGYCVITNVNKPFEQKNVIEDLFRFHIPIIPMYPSFHVLNLSVSHTHDPMCPSFHACVARGTSLSLSLSLSLARYQEPGSATRTGRGHVLQQHGCGVPKEGRPRKRPSSVPKGARGVPSRVRPGAPDVATSYKNIGIVYHHQGNVVEATEMYTKALAVP